MVPTGMTNYDIENYLEKIYKIKVIKVESSIENGKILMKYLLIQKIHQYVYMFIIKYVTGKMKRAILNKYGPIVKEDDFRRAFVTMASNNFKLNLIIRS